jgi:hypothetical protein
MSRYRCGVPRVGVEVVGNEIERVSGFVILEIKKVFEVVWFDRSSQCYPDNFMFVCIFCMAITTSS